MSDLARSARWYADLFDLELANEFYEDSAVRGVVLADHAGGFVIGLREREYCASSPVLNGFDVCAFMLRTPEQMTSVIARCDELGILMATSTTAESRDALISPLRRDRLLVAAPHRTPGTFAGVESAWAAGDYTPAPTRLSRRRTATVMHEYESGIFSQDLQCQRDRTALGTAVRAGLRGRQPPVGVMVRPSYWVGVCE